MTSENIKEQMQEDLLSILESFGIEEAMNGRDWETLKTLVCDRIIHYINKISNEN